MADQHTSNEAARGPCFITHINRFKLTDKDWIKSCQDSATEHRSTSPSKQEEKYTALISYPTKQSINSAAFSLIAFESFSIFKGLQDECLLSYQQGHNRAPRINVL